MTKWPMERSAASAVLALFGAAVLPFEAEGQTPAVHAACYVPDVGVIYMIDKEGLPSTCVAEDHVQIAWSEGGGDGTVADGSITTAKLDDRAVTADKIALSTIGSEHIAGGSVGSDAIEDGSVQAADLHADAVTLEFQHVVPGYTTVSAGFTAQPQAFCPSGSIVVAGGWDAQGQAGDVVRESFASDVDTWSLLVVNDYEVDVDVRPVITCISISP